MMSLVGGSGGRLGRRLEMRRRTDSEFEGKPMAEGGTKGGWDGEVVVVEVKKSV